jgi:hypothetical protein
MRLLAASISLAALLLTSACARARVTTTIKPDGSWTRTVAFTGQEKKEGNMAPTIEDTFVIPSGAGWKSAETKKNADRILTLERTLAAGAKLQGDVSLKAGEEGKLTLINEVTVTRLAPRRFEYRETLKWKGDPLKNNLKPEDIAEIKAALPKSLATDANARALATKAAELIFPVMFGPGDPLLAIGLLHPDLAERRMSQLLGGALMKALEEQFGDKMQVSERREVVRRLISTSFSSTKPAQPDPSAGPPSSKGSGLTPLMFIVKTPGHIVSSNGQADDFTGEVYWALFSDAATLKDLVLTAIIETEGK